MIYILQQFYKADTEMEMVVNPGWRDDFKYLFELCRALRFMKENGPYPVIKWSNLLSLHIVRWNSLGIYALIWHVLIPKCIMTLKIPCSVVSYA